MRQAGRYLPEYRALRSRWDFLTVTKTPELATKVTLQPLRRFPLDAAILFSDIMTPVEGMGVPLAFRPGPVVDPPVRSREAVDALRVPEPAESVPFVIETVRMLRSELGTTPLIGFAGAPFTLFCYVVQGSGSKTFSAAKRFLYAEPEAARLLLEKLARLTERYLIAQAEAGAQALMLFDSWIGLLAPADFRRWVVPVLRPMLESLRALDQPVIYFPNQGSMLLRDVRELPVDVVGIDWRTPLSHAREVLGDSIAVQGNLDPAALFAPPRALDSRIDAVLTEAGAAPGHIFNLGHGIEPDTDPDAVARLVDRVHAKTQQGEPR